MGDMRMRFFDRLAASTLLLIGLSMGLTMGLTTGPAAAQGSKTLPSEIPAKFKPTGYGFDHVRREVMIPMRDGVKLHTVILVPKGAKGAPILLTRTPYDADALTSRTRQLRTSARSCTATTTPPTSSSRAATSAWSRTSAASTAPRATT